MSVKVHLIAFLLLVSEMAFACDCVRFMTPEEAFLKSKFVAYGIVLNIKSGEPNNSSRLTGEFQALEVFKGTANSIKAVQGDEYNSAGMCMVKLEPGEYILYSDNGTVFVNSCNPSMKIANYTPEKKSLILKSIRNLGELSNKK